MHLYTVFLTALMYLTPIIYPMSIVAGEGKIIIVNLNPLTGILNMFREVVMYNRIPSAFELLVFLVVVLATLALGLWVFYKQQDEFILNL